ncbi:GATA transcription factor (Ams2), putative [Talaromyces stipitatus ATCC 10500]|uniref:GATA transcription factor (Ams2), putative n=1 Tax=Talaromyces stipitatus (strain ATCC 10500 / CBS 375.48 / QM 6759 / NRRL 1006) TaxID=441959 RepID=B8LSU1_TALSN|nr:GATA transcription factor (Ams2), putative [Talaromyces stipitatus ATCC 10500]EED22938.1 GATA transcription factor (Ams2), putative [Talaromyces stipitatus ATCC 10500]
MEVQDGITVRPMRLKVLYTFDDQNKTNCLARWPHLLDIQTAYLDEKTQIGVIELKTCIQAIVSASPELVAKLGQDYTVYAYDYSEYETPLVGQGMLSWVLASASPTPNAPAHQSKTIVTGRVSKNVLGLFSKGAQETLEVKLRLVPVPTLMQSEYLESMQRYRELSNIIPQDFDAQAWSSFVQQNPHIFATSQRSQSSPGVSGPIDHSGIEKFHQLLSEGSTPREFPHPHPDSTASSPVDPPSRSETPVGMQMITQMSRQPSATGHGRRGSEVSIRPLSRASVRESDFQRPGTVTRRGSVYSGYGSGDEAMEHPPRKRAKLFRADVTGKDDLNIERQPGSLRVAASTAASVRIHRPTPVSSTQHPAASSLEEPVRPPTPISRTSNEGPRRGRPAPSLLRESSINSTTSYRSPYPAYDDVPSTDLPDASPDDHRYQGIFESQFTMPSSPPIMDAGLPSRSSPVLPPLRNPPDSGFMSATLEDLMDEDGCIRTHNLYDHNDATGMTNCEPTKQAHQDQVTGNQNSQANHESVSRQQKDDYLASDSLYESLSSKEAPTLPPQHSSTSSRPSSRTSIRPAQKLAPAPLSQSEIEQLMSSIPASDPVLPPSSYMHHANTWSGPMSDMPSAETPLPQPVEEKGKGRSGAGARRSRQVAARLENCVRDGQAPPFCYNCGAIETPTWRRAWSKHFEGSEQDANDCLKDPMCLFWTATDRIDGEKVTKFRLYKKTLGDADKDFDQILLCNPCGLWLQKFRSMRPQNRWTKQPIKDKRKRSSRPRKGPLTNGAVASTRIRSKSQANSVPGSSPAHTDTSSPAGDNGSQAGDDGVTPAVENENENEDTNGYADEQSNKRVRANSAEPTSNTLQSRWDENAAMEALKRAIQSSPARNLDVHVSKSHDENLTPKPVRRALFPQSNHDGPLKTLADKENTPSATNRNLDGLFESPSFDLALRNTPTPKRRMPRSHERRLSLPFCSPSANRTKQTTSGQSPSTSRSRQTRPNSDKGASTDDTVENRSSFPSVDDIVLDSLLDPWHSLPQSDIYDPFSDWSPTGENGNSILQFPSNFGDDDALINAVLAESELQNTTDTRVSFAGNTTLNDTALPQSRNNEQGQAEAEVTVTSN